jgi:Flp pilus assembly protein TadD
LGTALFQVGELSQAEQQIRASLTLNPQNAEAHNVLCAIRGSQNDVPGAIVEFQEAVRINPRHPDAQNNLNNARQALQESRAK